MKRTYILTLTLLFVLQGIGIGLAAGEEKAKPGLSQFLDSTANTSSSQHSILDEESMDHDPKDVQNTGSEVSSDDPQLKPDSEKTDSEVTPEEPEHLSGPMNADLRDRLNTDVVDPSATVTANSDDNADFTSDAEEDRELSDSTETSVDASTDDPAGPEIETGEPEVKPEKNQDNTSPSANEPVKPGTKDSEVIPSSKATTGNEQKYTPVQKKAEQSKAATTAQKSTEPSKSAIPAQEASPRNDSVKSNGTSETISDDSGDSDDTELTETAQVSRTDELAKQNGILPKMSFLFKEFGKWLDELIGSVESIF